jgi:hypothetical protein
MTCKTSNRLRAWASDVMCLAKIIGCDQDLRDAAELIDAQRGYMLNAMIALQAGGTKSEAIGILQSGLKIGDE